MVTPSDVFFYDADSFISPQHPSIFLTSYSLHCNLRYDLSDISNGCFFGYLNDELDNAADCQGKSWKY